MNLKFSDHVIESDDELFQESTTPMVDLGTYELKDLNTRKLYLKNRLQMLMSKEYMNCKISILPLNDCP